MRIIKELVEIWPNEVCDRRAKLVKNGTVEDRGTE